MGFLSIIGLILILSILILLILIGKDSGGITTSSNFNGSGSFGGSSQANTGSLSGGPKFGK